VTALIVIVIVILFGIWSLIHLGGINPN